MRQRAGRADPATPCDWRPLRVGLRPIGVDHACALMIPADSMAEFEDQVEWFAKTVL